MKGFTMIVYTILSIIFGTIFLIFLQNYVEIIDIEIAKQNMENQKNLTKNL